MSKWIRTAVATALLLTANAAWAASGTDPNDTDGGIDVLRSSVRVVEHPQRRDRVVVRVETQRALRLETGKGSIYWQLDSRDSGAPDYEVYIFGDPEADDPPGPVFCLVQRPNGADKYFAKVNVFAGAEFGARCSFPVWVIDIERRIRWRLAGRLDGVIDRAPDAGWYGG